jgi:hypothetical protein
MDYRITGVLPTIAMTSSMWFFPRDRVPTPMAPYAAKLLQSALDSDVVLERFVERRDGELIARLAETLRIYVDNAKLTSALLPVFDRVANQRQSHSTLLGRAKLFESYGHLLAVQRTLPANDLSAIASVLEQVSRDREQVRRTMCVVVSKTTLFAGC